MIDFSGSRCNDQVLSSSFRKWLRKVIRTSSALKLGKTSYKQVREEEEEEEEDNERAIETETVRTERGAK
ncbi:hypothetical protein F2Q69_00024023 [Brassica cretica]|uniref:Uncharacterized protein n=1 Tax=Brassica cretica TaxID=69181 RepID=A0A8S9Q6D6_BRACR|nr:hypothetical protein F2Q69_00024023 [Brassica cretica]